MMEKQRFVATFERLERGRLLFNEGRYFEAHEEWEAAWLVEEEPARTMLQCLIQIAAGCHKAGQGQPSGCARLIGAGLEKLSRSATRTPSVEAFAREMAGVHASALEWQRGERDGLGPIPVLPPAGAPPGR